MCGTRYIEYVPTGGKIRLLLWLTIDYNPNAHTHTYTHLPLHSIYSINRSKNANINYIALVKHPPFRMDVIKFSNNFHSVCVVCVFEGA